MKNWFDSTSTCCFLCHLLCRENKEMTPTHQNWSKLRWQMRSNRTSLSASSCTISNSLNSELQVGKCNSFPVWDEERKYTSIKTEPALEQTDSYLTLVHRCIWFVWPWLEAETEPDLLLDLFYCWEFRWEDPNGSQAAFRAGRPSASFQSWEMLLPTALWWASADRTTTTALFNTLHDLLKGQVHPTNEEQIVHYLLIIYCARFLYQSVRVCCCLGS